MYALSSSSANSHRAQVHNEISYNAHTPKVNFNQQKGIDGRKGGGNGGLIGQKQGVENKEAANGECKTGKGWKGEGKDSAQAR